MAWEQYKADFNAMSDEEIASEVEQSQALVDENQDWIDAVAAWKAAGRPRDNSKGDE